MSSLRFRRRRPRAAGSRSPHAPSRLRIATGLALAIALAGCGSGSDDSPAAPASIDAQAIVAGSAIGAPTIDVAQALKLLNDARAVPRDCDGKGTQPAVPSLRWNAELEQAATAHSEWMQANDTFSHAGADGSTVGTRATDAGYEWKTVGENIAAGQPDVPAVIAAWLASPGHCLNIMHPGFVDAGLALKPGTSSNTYRTWWTLVLGGPR